MPNLLAYGLLLLFALAMVGRLAFHFVRMFRNNDLVLRELVGSFTLNADGDAAFDELVSAIKAAGLPVQHANKLKREVVIRCLTRPISLLLWRSWTDKLLFTVAAGKSGRTRVNVYAIPNLLKVKRARNEDVRDAGEVIAAVQQQACAR